MIRSFWYLAQIVALTAVTAWLLRQTGQFTLQLSSYRVQGESGIVVILLLIALLILLALHRIWLGIVRFPKTWARYRRDVRLIRGHTALTRSLSALASGDTKIAHYQAWRARRFLPDFIAVPTILIATTAEKQGRTQEAATALQSLLKTEARDIGVRGLVQAALNGGDFSRALNIARDALKQTPQTATLARLVYDLECQNGEFAAARIRQKFLIRKRALSRDIANRDIVAFHIEAARMLQAADDIRGALKRACAAHALDASSVPAACELVDLYIHMNKRGRAVRVVERSFALSPHPDLCMRWARLVPVGKTMTARMKFFERLLALAPLSGDAQLMLANAAMNEQLWGEARSYLNMAEKLMPTMRMYKMQARYMELQGDAAGARAALEQGMNAQADPVWHCRVTGRVFDQWVALTPDHHFMSIVWGVPGQRHAASPEAFLTYS